MAVTLNLNPDQRMLKQFGLLCVAVFGGLGVWQVTAAGISWSSGAMLVLAVLGGLLGWLRPLWLRPVFVGWMILAFPIGWTISHLLLGLLYFGVFTSLGLLLRIMGKDSLRLQRPGHSGSCWQDRSQETDLKRYLRQY